MWAKGRGTTTEVCIPWRPQPSRLAAYERTRDWYIAQGFTVREADVDGEPFNLAAVRNHLVRTSTADVVILSDADTTPEPAPLEHAIHLAKLSNRVHLPYHLYRIGGKYIPGATSGIYVTTPEAWWSTNGQDEQFRGWGYEDSAWRLAHTTLNGPVGIVPGIATAEEHELASRRQRVTNRTRHQLYIKAYGHPDRMRELVGL